MFPWGAQGAFALARGGPARSGDPASWEPLRSPLAVRARRLRGACRGLDRGEDSFNAGVITALAAGCPVGVGLRDACAVAGQKVQQDDGFYGLAEALPADGSRAFWSA